MAKNKDGRVYSAVVLNAMDQLRKELKIALVAKGVPNVYRLSEGEDALRQLEDLIGDIKCLVVRVNVNRKSLANGQPPRYGYIDESRSVDEFNARFTRIQSKIDNYVEDYRIKVSGRVLIKSGTAGRKLGDWANSLYQSRLKV